MADISEFIKKYNEYKTTFKVTSYDDNNDVHLCSDETQENINFDAIIESKYPESYEYRPESFDSIYINNNDIYCIEFKNEKKPDKKDIENKLIDGKQELDKMFIYLNIQKNNYKFIFCVVYNKSAPISERYKRGIQNYTIEMYLKKHQENNLVDYIITEDVDFFTKQFRKKLGKDLKCE